MTDEEIKQLIESNAGTAQAILEAIAEARQEREELREGTIPTNPVAFPIKLDFNTDVAGFNMYALTHNAPAEEVPEPLSILGTLTFSTFLAAKVYQRKQKRSV